MTAAAATELWRMSATELAGRIRTRQVSSAEVVEAHLRRIEAVNPAINAVVIVLGEQALRAAEAAEAGTTATADATVRVPALSGSSAPPAQASAAARRSGDAGVSVAWLIAAVLLLGLAGAAIVDVRRVWRKPGRS